MPRCNAGRDFQPNENLSDRLCGDCLFRGRRTSSDRMTAMTTRARSSVCLICSRKINAIRNRIEIHEHTFLPKSACKRHATGLQPRSNPLGDMKWQS